LFRPFILALFAIVFLLVASGCSMDPAASPIDPENSFWDRYFVNPLSIMLDWFAVHMNGEYGLSILVVTIIIRIFILPLMIKQYKSSRAMQELQPDIQAIRKKHKDNQQKMQEETMKLFQKHGVNPLAGCLPILIQMPILIALYGAIIRNPEISQHSFLWMDLGQPDPFWIIPILAGITTYLQQKVMAVTMNPQMQAMMYILPILILVMAGTFASALALYWVYSNIFTIVQSYFMYRNKSATKQEGAIS
jgi:YidC/Oxa1 family membrane protein insertase